MLAIATVTGALDHLHAKAPSLENDFHTSLQDCLQGYHAEDVKKKDRSAAKVQHYAKDPVKYPRQLGSVYLKDVVTTLVCKHVGVSDSELVH